MLARFSPEDKGLLRALRRQRKRLLAQRRKLRRPGFAEGWRCLADRFRGNLRHLFASQAALDARRWAERQRKAQRPAGARSHSKGEHHA